MIKKFDSDKSLGLCRISVAGVMAFVAALIFSAGCADVDDMMEERAERREERREQREKEKAKKQRTEKEQKAKDDYQGILDKEEALYSTTNTAPLYVTKPMAWFKETNDRMVFTRQKLLEVQARFNVIKGKYGRKLEEADNRMKGYPRLLEKAEAARIEALEKGYPVALEHIVIKDEEMLDDKIAEIKQRMEETRVLTVEEKTMFFAAQKAVMESRDKLKRFDKAYAEFQRTWDKVKMGQLGGISVDLMEEVNSAIDTTEIFINEWNKIQ